MGRKVSLDLRVHPGNPNVTVHHLLALVRDGKGRELGCMMFAQAWTGKWSAKKEQKAWNEISTRLEELSYQTGLVYEIVATGAEEFCEQQRKEQGWILLA